MPMIPSILKNKLKITFQDVLRAFSLDNQLSKQLHNNLYFAYFRAQSKKDFLSEALVKKVVSKFDSINFQTISELRKS